MLTIADIFKMQSTLNKRVGLDDKRFAVVFSKECSAEHLIEAGQWIDDILKAMSSEIEELRDCTFWKHWATEAQSGQRYRIKDVEAARKEVIDLLHFWISLAQILGMSPEMVSGMYAAKLAKNIRRQDDGYSIEIKDLAWQLFNEHPYDSPTGQPYPEAHSLEDLPNEVAAYYLDWAKRGTGEKSKCSSLSLQGNGCKLCRQKDCALRRYESTLENQDES